MRKLLMLMAGIVGFYLGSRVGREPSEAVDRAVKSVVGRPEVRGAAESVKDGVNEQTRRVTDRLKGEGPSSTAATSGSPWPSSAAV